MTSPSSTTSIPLVNLKRQYASLKAEIDAAVADVVASQSFISGARVDAFSAAWLKALGARHGAACSNGTTAITAALRALGIGAGDEVIIPSHTFFATAEAVYMVGAEPVFADIDPRNYTIDVGSVEIGERVRAIMPVHLYGGAADMGAVMQLAEEYGLKVVEDSAQAHLATFHGRCLGTIGDAGTFSFFPGKNLGAYGDAGFAVARDPAIGTILAKIVNHGRASKYSHDMIGDNMRMDEIQAAVLSVKLKHLAAWTARRQAIAAYYDSRLKPAGFKVIEPLANTTCVYHLYVAEASNRDDALQILNNKGIGAGIHYPVPVHRQPALADLPCSRVALPRTDRAAARVLSLPICGDITDAEAEIVCDAFLDVAAP